jgi:predicted lipid-binding transport protein (Tim44 family)
MKTSLWVVIALVTGIVGFLMGYSVSGYTGTKTMAERGRGTHDAAAHPPAPAAVAAAPAKAEAGGYPAAPEKAPAPQKATSTGPAAGAAPGKAASEGAKGGAAPGY